MQSDKMKKIEKDRIAGLIGGIAGRFLTALFVKIAWAFVASMCSLPPMTYWTAFAFTWVVAYFIGAIRKKSIPSGERCEDSE